MLALLYPQEERYFREHVLEMHSIPFQSPRMFWFFHFTVGTLLRCFLLSQQSFEKNRVIASYLAISSYSHIHLVTSVISFHFHIVNK